MRKSLMLTGFVIGTFLLHNINLIDTYASQTVHEVPSIPVEVAEEEFYSAGPGVPELNISLGSNEMQLQNSGSDIAEFALQFVGNPYVYGGTSLTNGADCSGFTQSVFSHFNIALPRTSYEQRNIGTTVDGLDNAQPGDLIAYHGHVGIYIGNGNIVHASTSTEGIVVSPATCKQIVSIRRVSTY